MSDYFDIEKLFKETKYYQGKNRKEYLTIFLDDYKNFLEKGHTSKEAVKLSLSNIDSLFLKKENVIETSFIYRWSCFFMVYTIFSSIISAIDSNFYFYFLIIGFFALLVFNLYILFVKKSRKYFDYLTLILFAFYLSIIIQILVVMIKSMGFDRISFYWRINDHFLGFYLNKQQINYIILYDYHIIGSIMTYICALICHLRCKSRANEEDSENLEKNDINYKVKWKYSYYIYLLVSLILIAVSVSEYFLLYRSGTKMSGGSSERLISPKYYSYEMFIVVTFLAGIIIYKLFISKDYSIVYFLLLIPLVAWIYSFIVVTSYAIRPYLPQRFFLMDFENLFIMRIYHCREGLDSDFGAFIATKAASFPIFNFITACVSFGISIILLTKHLMRIKA